jgi:Fungal N-terminal domain of STAND proteins
VDPLSIASGSVALATAAAQLGVQIYRIWESTKGVDQRLEAFASELKSLSSSLEAAGSALRNPQLVQAFTTAAGVQEPKKHLEAIKAILDDCRTSLKDLKAIVDGARNSKGVPSRGIFRKPATAFVLSLKDPEPIRIRSKLQTHNNAMQLCFQTIHLCV